MLRASLVANQHVPKTSPETSPVILSDRESSVLTLIRQQRDITAQEFADTLRISKRTVIPYLKSLQEKNVIRREGPKKGGWWRVLTDNAE